MASEIMLKHWKGSCQQIEHAKKPIEKLKNNILITHS